LGLNIRHKTNIILLVEWHEGHLCVHACTYVWIKSSAKCTYKNKNLLRNPLGIEIVAHENTFLFYRFRILRGSESCYERLVYCLTYIIMIPSKSVIILQYHIMHIQTTNLSKEDNFGSDIVIAIYFFPIARFWKNHIIVTRISAESWFCCTNTLVYNTVSCDC